MRKSDMALSQLAFLALAACATGCHRAAVRPDVLMLQLSQIQPIVRSHHGSEFYIPWRGAIKRNSTGTCLRVSLDRETVLLLSCDGRTSSVTVPSEDVWLDDNNVPQAWLGDTEWPQYVLRGGTVVEGYNVMLQMVPSGRFFLTVGYASQRDPRIVSRVYSTAKPGVPLISINGEARLFGKDGSLYLFRWAKPDRMRDLSVEIYQALNGRLELQRTVSIRPPSWLSPVLYPKDLSPFEDQVLLLSPGDGVGSKYYIFDLSTGEMQYIGFVRSHYALFLDPRLADQIRNGEFAKGLE